MADGQNYFDPSRLYEALKERGLLPEWTQDRDVTGDAGNMASYKPAYNRLFSANFPSRLGHEYVHAVQTNLLRSAAREIIDKGKEATTQEKQFLEAFKKLMSEQVGTVSQRSSSEADKNESALQRTLQELYHKRVGKPSNIEDKRYDEYRTNPKELQAWGIEAFIKDPSHYMDQEEAKKLSHLNPSFATEFDILLSMYEQLPKSVKESSAATRKDDIEHAKRWYKDSVAEEDKYHLFSSLYEDPFKSTIK